MQNMNFKALVAICLILGALAVQAANDDLETIQHQTLALCIQEINARNEAPRPTEPIFTSFEKASVRLMLLFSGALDNMIASLITKTSFLADVFAGSAYANDYLILLLGAYQLGYSAISIYISCLPARKNVSYPKRILMAFSGSIPGLALLIALPSIVSQWSISPTGLLTLLLTVLTFLGICIGLISSSMLSLLCALPFAYRNANFIGFGMCDVGSSLAFVITSSLMPLPNPNTTCLSAANQTLNGQNSSNLSTQVATLQIPSIDRTYFISFAVISFVTAILGIIFSYSSMRGALIPYHSSQSQVATTSLASDLVQGGSLTQQLFENHITCSYIISIGILSVVTAVVMPSVFPSVAASSPDPTNLIKTNLFVPLTWLTVSVVTTGCIIGAGSGFTASFKPPLLIILSPIFVIITAVLLFLCNFKNFSSKQCSDPFPGAPRLFKSDAFYFSMVVLFCIVHGYSRGMLIKTASDHVSAKRLKEKLGSLLNMSIRIGQMVAPFISMAIYYGYCKCNPFTTKA